MGATDSADPVAGGPPTYRRRPAKVLDADVRKPLAGRGIDTFFLLFSAIGALWLAVLLLEDAWRLPGAVIPAVIVFWAVVAYLVLPRLHFLLSSLYVPPYFFGRTRTSDGLLGDPVNLAVDGTARQIHATMTRAGWTLADDITARSALGIIAASVLRRPYAGAPVSPLFIFGRQQCLAYEQEVEGSPAERHHVRFWRTPDGWLLPGGHRVGWLAAGTYDRKVGLSIYTMQVTHKIDADIDVERDYIVDSVRYYDPPAQVRTIKDFSTGYHVHNGGGDSIETNGDLPVLDLRQVDATTQEIPDGVARAARGYSDPQAAGGVASPDDDAPAPVSAKGPARAPLSILVGSVLAMCTALLAAVRAAFLFSRSGDPFGDLGVTSAAISTNRVIAAVVLFGLAAIVVVLAILTLTGRPGARIWLMVLVALGTIWGEVVRLVNHEGQLHLLGYLNLALNVLILLLLSSDPARQFSRRQRPEQSSS